MLDRRGRSSPRGCPLPPPPPLAASAAAIEAVLGDGDLLREILLRLGFPTSLVCAAAVSKRWLSHASDPAFLRCFRDRNPRRLLGFYLTSTVYHLQKRLVDFVPLPQPAELSSVLRFGCFNLNAYKGPALCITDCRNGRVFISLYHPAENNFTHGVHTPLHPARGLVTVPDFPVITHEDSVDVRSYHLLSKESGNGLSYYWFQMELKVNKGAQVYVHMLQDNVWRMLISATTELNGWPPRSQDSLIVEDRVYVAATMTSNLLLDLTSSSCSTIELPDGVFNKGNTVMSQANDSGVYLLHLEELQLSIWLLRGTNGSMGGWSLVDTFSMLDMCANLGITNCTVEDGHTTAVYINAVGDNAEFVFLDMDQCILYLDVRCGALRKVYEKSEYYDSYGCRVCPYMMPWPPIFPAPKE
ncbi:unnamed protein product [Urochloa humidicola]